MTDPAHLRPCQANFQPLSPLELFDRAIEVHADRHAVSWHGATWTYAGFGQIVARFANFLQQQGVRPGDVVSVLSSNRPEMLAAHFAVPMVGAVLNTINTRLDAKEIAFIARHAGAVMLFADPANRANARRVANQMALKLFVFSVNGRDEMANEGVCFLEGAAAPPPDYRSFVTDECQPICINYTSGTTGDPKGVVYTHRGAYLNALANVLALGFDHRSNYLWVLPMFHCNGWCHAWAVIAAGGSNLCLDRVDPAEIFEAIGEKSVTHIACAPTVLYMLLGAPERRPLGRDRRIVVATGGASPTPTLIAEMDRLGFELIHLYGLTESYGPATMSRLDDEDKVLDTSEKSVRLARQGSRHFTGGRVCVVDPSGTEVPWDGATVGEITLQGNTLMAGYHRDPAATKQAFRGGRFHTGDLAVRHPNGEIEIRDRAKDIIISGGENISSLEIERVLHRHPAVLLAAVVAQPHPKWGEVPCAFVEIKDGTKANSDDLTLFCRAELARFKVPKRFIFGALPKTGTGKVQKYLLRERARKDAGT